MKAKENINEVIERRWEERSNHLEEVRKRMRVSWRNDTTILASYFEACVINWKAYRGPKTENNIARVYGTYKQAVFGDCDVPLTADPMSLQGKKWQEWDRLRDTPKDVAKRRFITYLSEIDPLLIDVMPNEIPPEGFPVDQNRMKICAKCNTSVGCSRPLTDQNKIVLRRQLFEDESLHHIENLREWMINALANQRCIWGVHKPISKAEAKPFSSWFSRDENRGFFPYDSSNIMLMVRDLIHFQYEIAYDMQQNKTEYSVNDINAQVIKVTCLVKYFLELTGEQFVFEVPCTRDSEVCNQRRISDRGENHKHPLELEAPTVDYTPYEEAVILRKKCISLGLPAATGVCTDINKRCDIYRARIEEYYTRLKNAAIAKKNNSLRLRNHLQEKMQVRQLSEDLLRKQILNACVENDCDKLLFLGKRGGSLDVETARGVFPLLCMMLNGATVTYIETLIKYGCNINYCNKFGLTPLILACRTKDVRLIHCLMKHSADEVQSGGSVMLQRCPLHFCCLHNSEEEAKVLLDYVREGGDDELRVIRFLDSPDINGETPLMVAARYRNGLMCKTILNCGANPGTRNLKKQNAAYIARNHGWSELADFLDKKISAGVAKVETLSDIQFEKTQRYASLQAREQIFRFMKCFLNLFQGQATSTLLGNPNFTQKYAEVHGYQGQQNQNNITNRYYYYIVMKNHENSPDIHEEYKKMSEYISNVVDIMRQGNCYPNIESSPNPISFTPLMCAVLIGDLRSMRLLIREGADPNHCNNQGMTALMLAALFNYLEVIVELLHLGARLDLVDNEGYTALAYANSLPLPGILKKSDVNILLNGDNEVAKRMTASELLKIAQNATLIELKGAYEENMRINTQDCVAADYHNMKLLEKNGLSVVEFVEDIHRHVIRSKSIGDKSEEPAVRRNIVERTMSAEDLQDEQEFQDIMASRQLLKEEQEKLDAEREARRCPLCTLQIPCAHFQILATLTAYKEKLKNGQITKNFSPAKINQSAKTKKYFDIKAKNVLKEAGLERDVDRSITFYQYGKKKQVKHALVQDGDLGACVHDEVQAMVESNDLETKSEEIDDTFDDGRDNHIAARLEGDPATDNDIKAAIPNLGLEITNATVTVTKSDENRAYKSLLKDPAHKKKYKSKRRVIRFVIDDIVLPGGVAEGDADIKVVEKYEDALVANMTDVDTAEFQQIVPRVLTPLKNGLLTKEQKDIAVDSFFKGVMQEHAKDFTMKIGENPVNVAKRGVFMFDKTELLHNDDEMDEKSTNKTIASREVVESSLTLKDALHSIQVSGYMLIGVYSVHLGTKPIDFINVNLNVWSQALDATTNEILHNMDKRGDGIISCIDFKTWKPTRPPCDTCAFGIVRYNDLSTRSDKLTIHCATCYARKSLFGKLSSSIPRSVRKKLVSDWPFQHLKDIRTNSQEMPLILKPAASAKTIPENSKSAEGVTTYQVQSVFVKRESSVNPLCVDIPSKTKFLGDDESTISNSTLLSEVTLATLSTQSSNGELDEIKYGPRDLVLISKLIAKGDFEVAEKVLRIAISKPEYIGDEGILHLSTLIQLQAEMYKLSGYWILALGLLLDAADWRITRLGFDHPLTLKAYAAVASCLSAMKLEDKIRLYFLSITKQFDHTIPNERNTQIMQSIVDCKR